MTRLPFHDRHDAGRVLASHLAHYRAAPGLLVLVLALPRGGVAVAAEVAQALEAPLDVFIVRKLGYPGHPEYAMGAVASGGVRVMNPGMERVPPATVDEVVEEELAELRRRERLYRGERPPPVLAGRTVIVVDDGLATGATMKAAALAIRAQRPLRLCLAVPVGARESCEALQDCADEVVCPFTPEPFRAVGLWYADFPQAGDDEVRTLLAAAARRHPGGTPP